MTRTRTIGKKNTTNNLLLQWSLHIQYCKGRTNVTDSKSRKTTVHAHGCDGMSRLVPHQAGNQKATKHEISGPRVDQCCRDALKHPSPVEQDAMNKSLRPETRHKKCRGTSGIGKAIPSSTALASSQHTEKYSVEQQAATAFVFNIDVVAR